MPHGKTFQPVYTVVNPRIICNFLLFSI